MHYRLCCWAPVLGGGMGKSWSDCPPKGGHPQPSPGGLWESRALSRCSDAAPSLHDCTEFQESPSSGLNHLALHLPHPGFTVQSNCSSTGLASWEIRAEGREAAVLGQDSTRMAFWQGGKPGGSCPNRKMLEASKAQTIEKAYHYMARAEACPEGEVRSEIPGKDVSPPPLNARPMGRQDSTAGNSSVVGRKEAGHSWLLSCIHLPSAQPFAEREIHRGDPCPQHHRSKTPCFSGMLPLQPSPITCLSRHSCPVPIPRAGVETGWLQEQRQFPLTPSWQSQSSQSCWDPTSTADLFSLRSHQTPTKANCCHPVSVRDQTLPVLTGPHGSLSCPTALTALLSPQIPEGALPAALLLAHHCQAQLCPACQNAFSFFQPQKLPWPFICIVFRFIS